MNSLRIAVDLDGTIADLSTAFHEIEDRLFGPCLMDVAAKVERAAL